MVVSVAYKILLDISWGKLFEKASQPRWWSLIPFRNIYKTFALIKRGGLFIGTLVLSAVLPFVVMMLKNQMISTLTIGVIFIFNIWLYFSSMYLLAKKFNRSTRFAIGLMFFPWIFFPILALSKDSVCREAVVAQSS